MSTRPHRHPGLALGGALLVLLSGCTPSAPPPTSAAPSASAPASGPSPSGEPAGWQVDAGQAEVTIATVPPPGQPADGISVVNNTVTIDTPDGDLPEAGATLSLDLPAPVPDGDVAWFAWWDATTSDWLPVASKLSEDRTQLTAHTDHFSIWGTVVADAAEWADHALGNLAGARTDPPECPGTPPRWAEDVQVFDEKNSPLRWCAGSDPKNTDVLVVKAANNRGYGMGVTAAATPKWSYSSAFDATVVGQLTDVLAAGVRRVSAGLAGGVDSVGDLLPPGEEMHYGFTEKAVKAAFGASLTGTLLTVDSTFPQKFVGLTYLGASTAEAVSRRDVAVVSLVAVLQCANAAEKFSRTQDWGAMSEAAVSCLTASTSATATVAAQVALKLYPNMNPTVLGSRLGTVVGKVWQLWAVKDAFQLGWTVGEISSDGGYDTSVFRAKLRLTADQPKLGNLVIRPDGLGGLKIDKPIAATGIARWAKNHCKGNDDPGRWIANYPKFRRSPDNTDLFAPFTIDVAAGQPKRIDIISPDPRTAAGIHVGSTVGQLLASYGPELVEVDLPALRAWEIVTPTGILAFANEDLAPGTDSDVVAMIRITTPDTPYDLYSTPLMGTGDGAGSCAQ